MNKDKFYTLAEFANSIDVTRQAVYKNEKTGLIPTVQIGKKKYVDVESQIVINYIRDTGRKFTKIIRPVKQPEIKVSQKSAVLKAAKGQAAAKNLDGGRYYKGVLRQAVFERDNFTCVQCGANVKSGAVLEVDHIKEFEDGGKTTLDNGQTLCTDCNKGKHALKKITENVEIISKYEFAKRVGEDRNMIARAIDSGKIDSDKSGKINYTTEIIKWYTAKDEEQPVQVLPAGENEIPDYLKDISDSGQLTFQQAKGMSKIELEKIKIYESIKKIRMETESKRNQLIARKMIRIVFGKIYEIDTNQFLTLKNKIIPEISGIMGCTDSAKLLESEKIVDSNIWETLKNVKFELDKFLKKIGDEPLDE